MLPRMLSLREDLAGLEVEFNDRREVVSVFAGGQRLRCHQTQFGIVCELPGPDGSGGGKGPVLQLRVTPKRVFARRIAELRSEQELDLGSGFQRHDV